MAASLELEPDRFVALLEKLVGEARHLQNNPPEHTPVEDRAGRHVLDVLTPLGEEAGGPLRIRHVSYAEGRGNIIVEYPGEPDGGILSFVGCHMDVVTANPEAWTFDPFSLSRDGDKLRGRGTTDCLGHVALLTEFFRQLAESRARIKRTVVGVFIANEENSKEEGYDVQCIGFGKMSTYHANDEYALLSDFVKGFRVMRELVMHFNG
ncbi:Acetylornithine deacetylase [Tetrabaena socialis]|uniref:Acetylornithine deacetylase n=1 Tax=Tetrabaena socialis TaxID=47790 RepID=A0A2J8AGF4_9CHLO|nr:Acetylornithine deacetylase [Tetrabaena socialis]|eukprot:PNH11605.1 Acetylornithine deacetylase [Tetrabaena socialis]